MHNIDIRDFPPQDDEFPKIILSSWNAQHSYRLLRKLGAGGRGLAFEAEILKGSREGTTVVVKIPNVDISRFDEEQVKARLFELKASFHSELESAMELNGIQGVAAIIDGGTPPWRVRHKFPFIDTIPFAVYEFVSGLDLDDWCAKHHSTDGAFKGIRDVRVWFRLAKQILSTIQSVHHQRIIHGDLWPKNIRVNDAGNITIIDFGECWKMDTARDHESDFSSSHRHAYLAPERYRSEPNHRRKWYTPADIYSIGGILLFLATGRQPPLPYEDRELKKNRRMKDDIIVALAEANVEVYCRYPGIADIISICMHPRVEDRVSRVSQILDSLELFSPDAELRVSDPDEAFSRINEEVNAIQSTIESIRSNPKTVHPVFQRLVLSRIQQLRDDIAPITSNLFVLEGDRETHINGLLTCLDSLQSDDEIIALTSSQFWKPGNFGPCGRLSTKLLECIARKVKVKWVTVTNNDPSEIDRDVIGNQRKGLEQYLQLIGQTEPRNFVSKAGAFFLGFCPRAEDEIDQMRKARQAFILLRHDDEWLLVAPDYRIGEYGPRRQSVSVETTVTSLRIWANARRTDDLKMKHQDYLVDSVSVLDWPHSPNPH